MTFVIEPVNSYRFSSRQQGEGAPAPGSFRQKVCEFECGLRNPSRCEARAAGRGSPGPDDLGLVCCLATLSSPHTCLPPPPYPSAIWCKKTYSKILPCLHCHQHSNRLLYIHDVSVKEADNFTLHKSGIPRNIHQL
ncbi:hypothetical protein J6590_048205 [Homalodisca vitripennis]|nr:hypothetical protein J6590_048205 [Homalodisca vitripennis]